MFGGAEGDEKHPKSAALTLLPNSHLRLVASDFSKQYWNNVPETQKKIEDLCLTPEKIPLIDAIPEGLYSMPEKESEVPYFRGSVFDTEELAEQFKSSDSLNILFEQSQLEIRVRKPLLPLNLSQIGLVGASGLMNGLVDCKHPHVIKGKIVRQKKTSETVNPERDCSELREVESNKMIFNILTPDSYISVS